ncbi:unnamed protein product [Ectocarpus sp. CCAP 1310/34]|nr:unnamed protein product [Ectocarpus sp. CCAP 1310/34]
MVVWPGCHRSAPPPVPAFEDFTTKKKAPVKSGGRGSGGGDSGDSDSSHLRGSTSSNRGRAQPSSSASSSSERADKKGVKKKSRTSRPSSDTAGGASSDSGSERSLPRKTSSGRISRQQVKRRLDDGATGPEAFTLLLRLLSEQFDVGDRQESFLRLQEFGVSNGTLFADYLRAFRLLVSSVTGSERVLAPSVSMVLEIVRNSVSKQFPSLAPMLYPGDLATAVTPFDSIDAMWQAFAPLATNKTPAIGGSEYFSLSSTPGSSQPRRSQNRATAPAPSGRRAQGSAHNPVVLAVQSQDGGNDPFSRDYNAWPAKQGDWSDVYQVSSSFRNTGDPFCGRLS